MPKKPHERVEIEENGDTFSVYSPYHPDFIDQAQSMNGDWDGEAWVFDARDRQDVRETLVDVYGTDGLPVPYADVQISISAFSWKQQDLFGLGRQLAYRKSRDEPVSLGEGVRMQDAGFRSSGGSQQYPEIGDPVSDGEKPAVIVRDVPTILLEDFEDEYYKILELDTEDSKEGLTEEERDHVRRVEKAFSMFDHITQGPQGIKEPFLHFEKGTTVQEIYEWFENDCGVLVAYLTGNHDHPFDPPNA